MAKEKTNKAATNIAVEELEKDDLGNNPKIVDLAIMPFQIVVESNQYVLVKPSTVKSGAHEGMVKYDPIGYYTSLSGCLSKIVREKIVSTNKQFTLEQFVKRYEGMMAELIDAVGTTETA